MVFDFRQRPKVLYYGPRAYGRDREGPVHREYVLWPAWAYQVLAPELRKRTLNTFQKAVLGFCRAGLVDAQSIGDKLVLSTDLILFILAELKELGYLEEGSVVADKGEKALDEGLAYDGEPVMGYVFQDPWTGDLFPWLADEMRSNEYEQRGRVIEVSVPSEKGMRSIRTLPIEPGYSQPVDYPTYDGVLNAIRRCGSRQRDEWLWEDPDDDYEPSKVWSRPLIDTVSFLGEPEAVYLVTFLYVPSGHEGLGWYAADPFGLGISTQLHYRVERVRKQYPLLDEKLERMESGDTRLFGEQGPSLEKLQEMAVGEVTRRLSPNIQEHVAFESIVTMERVRQEVACLGSDCPPERLKWALRLCVQSLESVFGALAGKFPLESVWKRVHVARESPQTGVVDFRPQQDGEWLKATYRSALLAVGFEEPIPDALLSVKPGQIRAVAEFGELWRLRPLVCATALAAQGDADHPLHGAAREDPRMLRAIDEIASLGGQAGHAGSEEVTLDDVNALVERTYEVVVLLT
jgi:hypothetical protein